MKKGVAVIILLILLISLSIVMSIESEYVGEIVSSKKVEDIDDSEPIQEFDILGLNSISFDVSSSKTLTTEEVEKTSLEGSVKNVYEFSNLKVETVYEKADTGFPGVDKPIKQSLKLTNLLNEPVDITFNIRYGIKSDKVIWDGTEYAVTEIPKYFKAYEVKEKIPPELPETPEITILRGSKLEFGTNYIDFRDVVGLDYSVSAYSEEDENYIELRLNLKFKPLETLIVDPEIGLVPHSKPVIYDIDDYPNPVLQNDDITFTVNYSSPVDTVNMRVCKSSAINEGVCVGGEYCSKLNTRDNPIMCAYTTNIQPDVYDYYGHVCYEELSGKMLWNKTFGGSNSDSCSSVVETSDSGFVLSGYANLWGNNDTSWIIKTDNNGSILWNNTGSGKTGIKSSIETIDGFLSVGTESYYSWYRDGLVIKTDLNGNHLWDKTFNIGFGRDDFYKIIKTYDNNFLISGDREENYLCSQMFIMKVDDNGIEIWNKTFGLTSYNCDHDTTFGGTSVIETSDNGLIVIGCFRNFTSNDDDALIIKTDSKGNHLWNKTFGGSNTDCYYSIINTSDGGLALLGSTYSFGAGNSDVWLVKTDSNGNHLWNKTFGGSSKDEGYSVVETSDGGLALLGSTYSFGAGNSDVWLVKTDSNGNHLGDTILGGINYDAGYSIIQTSDNRLVLLGRTNSFGAGNSDFWLIKLEEGKQTICSDPYQGNFTVLPAGKLQITDIIPIQVVRDVDLVKDKTGLVRVVVESSEDNVNAKVRLFFEDKPIGTETRTFNTGPTNVDFNFKPDKPGTNLKLRAEVEET